MIYLITYRSSPILDNETLTRRREKKIPSRSRAINDINLEKFNEILLNTNWSLLINEDDPNEAYNNFISEFSRICEVCFPLKIIKGKQMNKFYSPWLSRGLLKSISKKNSLYKKICSITHLSSWAKVQSLQKQIEPLDTYC